MHIQEGTNTTLTTCTKMTEEVDRRHGVNGNSSSQGASEDAPVSNTALNATGGRLKFFKDGKFILELVRGCAREGERAGWVSVPRKTFWPPAAAPGGPPPPPPPSAPLSVSDDNSSVQSSPWQRDHCWKQAAPRRNVSKALAMYYCRPAALRSALIHAASRLKRRRPYDTSRLDGLADAARDRRNGDAGSPGDAVDGPDDDREKYYHMKLKKPYQYRKLRVYTKTRPRIRRGELAAAIGKLRERAPAPQVPVNAKLASCRQEHAMVSPRKRILRELERVSLEDQGTKRRARTAPALSTASYPPSPGPSHAPRSADTPPARAVNGVPPARPAPQAQSAPPAKHVGSYSIHSLLSMGEDTRAPPPAPPPDPRESPGASAGSPEAWRGEAWRGEAWRGEAWRGGGARWARREWREEWPLAYGYGYAPLYRPPAPTPLWLHYPLPPPAAPSPWAPLAIPLLTDHIPKDEPTSDLPLNLSKH